MKRFELIFTALLVPIDYLMLVLAAIAAYYLRLEEGIVGLRPIITILPFNQYIKITLVVSLGWLLIFVLAGLYKIRRHKLLNDLSAIFLACSTGILAVISYLFFSRELFTSRFIVLAVWALSVIFIIFGRFIIYSIQNILLKFEVGAHRIIIIGNDNITELIADELHRNPKLGYKIVDRFPRFEEDAKKKILEIHQVNPIDEIVQADSSISRYESIGIIDFANENHITFRYAAGPFEARVTRVKIDTIAEIPVIEIEKTPLDGWGKIGKKIFDILGAIFLIIITSPVMLLLAIAIKLDSRGPVFFKYQRVGEKGKPFNFIKFRTMKHGMHWMRFDENFRKEHEDLRAGTPMIKFKDDPRITWVGKFLRRFSLDELAQLFLVLVGTMSLVGPRAHEIEEVANYKKEYKQVLDIKPGITGLAQVSGRSDLTFNDEVKLDTFYIENWSPKLDLQIIFKTPMAVIRKRSAL
jgi:exopolysaccharide biosynthesis polyprenyl glycosylphosphotransferase